MASETGSIRELQYAMWEVRYTVLIQLYHWRLRYDGAWTVAPEEPATQQAERLFDRHAANQRRVQI